MADNFNLGKLRVDKTVVDKAVQSSSDFAAHFGLCSSALYVRAASLQVRAALPIGRAELFPRLESCQNDIAALRTVNNEHFTVRSKPVLDAKSDEKRILSWKETKQEAGKKIEDAALKARDQLSRELDSIEAVLSTTRENITLAETVRANGLRLVVEVTPDGCADVARII
jgi:hypothetical protein